MNEVGYVFEWFKFIIELYTGNLIATEPWKAVGLEYW